MIFSSLRSYGTVTVRTPHTHTFCPLFWFQLKQPAIISKKFPNFMGTNDRWSAWCDTYKLSMFDCCLQCDRMTLAQMSILRFISMFVISRAGMHRKSWKQILCELQVISRKMNDNRSKVRRVRVVTRKWSMEEEQEILHYIKRYLDNLHLPDDGPVRTTQIASIIFCPTNDLNANIFNFRRKCRPAISSKRCRRPWNSM